MTIITNPKVMFVTKSGERPIITAIKVKIRNECEREVVLTSNNVLRIRLPEEYLAGDGS